MSSTFGFAFADLFAGIGGFHAALTGLGGTLAIAAEKDPYAAATYKRNWGSEPFEDVVELANHRLDAVPTINVLAGGFPCQPFSKSGRQLGMREERGQVFDEMLKIIAARTPALVVLENVRNLAGPRQIEGVWQHVIHSLRGAGYAVSATPSIVSPHRLPANLGGSPQSRERVFILGVFVGPQRAAEMSERTEPIDVAPDGLWDPSGWDLFDGYVDSDDAAVNYRWSDDEVQWLSVWGDFLKRTKKVRLPGHPLWSDYWNDDVEIDETAPPWKRRFELRNIEFWTENRSVLRAWQRANPSLVSFPTSRRKFEWQAGEAPRELSELLIHLRPSGIRVKRPDYTPALVAMTQTPLLGRLSRKMTPRESARLQGFPDWFQLDHQADKYSYKQLGNAVNVGVAYYVVRDYVRKNQDLIKSAAGGNEVVESVLDSPKDPRVALDRLAMM